MMHSKWDSRYLNLAKEVGQWSKDPSRKIGAVAIGSKGQVLAQGYNGFPRGVNDVESRYNDRPTKYKYVVHAEMNVIYNAGFNGVSLDGSSLYVTGLPVCSECAKGIIQVGIKEVIMPTQSLPEDYHWMESWKLSMSMFEETDVKWRFVNV
jgi:dCMP deaminase